MKTLTQTVKIGMAAAVLVAGLATGVQAIVPGGAGSFGGEDRGLMFINIRGSTDLPSASAPRLWQNR
jgi:hypothetical protein